MNQVQIAIIVIVTIIVLCIIIYYIHQENKFKKMIESNFNQAADDVLNKNRGLVFENSTPESLPAFASFRKDQEPKFDESNLTQAEIKFDPLLEAAHALLDQPPKGDVFFGQFDLAKFPENVLNRELEHAVDISFDKLVKIKVLPELGQFVSKQFTYYLLDKHGTWLKFERGQKYLAAGLRLIVNLVDNEGVISNLQLANLFSELAKYAQHHAGHIRQTDSELLIRKLQQQLKSLSNVPLELSLYLVNKDDLDYRQIAKYFESNGFVNAEGVFEFWADGKVLFKISNEQGQPFAKTGKYHLFSINSKLHHHLNPQQSVDKIFDFAEHYVQYFDARLLTSNKLVLAERDYQALEKQIASYIMANKRQNIILGSPLIQRVFP